MSKIVKSGHTQLENLHMMFSSWPADLQSSVQNINAEFDGAPLASVQLLSWTYSTLSGPGACGMCTAQ